MKLTDLVGNDLDTASGRLGLAVAIAALAVAAGGYVGNLSTATVVALTLLPIAVGFPAFYYIRRRHVRHLPVPTKTFQPFRPLTVTEAWQRPDDVTRLYNAIVGDDGTVPLIVGPSGAGKSTLLRVLVRGRVESLPDAPLYDVIDSYGAFPENIEAMLADAGAGRRVILVFDQFEQWLAGLRRLPLTTRAAEQDKLRRLMAAAEASTDHFLALSIRSEWYYDLRFLGDALPPPSRACTIDGAPVGDDTNRLRNDILTAFREVLDNRELADAVVVRLGESGRLSPLEAQIVGAVAERACGPPPPGRRAATFDVQSLRQTAGIGAAIDSFFSAILDGAHDPDVCIKLLCALSIETRFRENMNRARLYDIMFERTEAVDDDVSYLVAQGIIVERKGGKLDLAHDFVAEYFQNESGSRLNPVERDNLFAHTHSKASADVFVSSDARPRLGVILASAFTVTMVARLLFGSGWRIGFLGPDVSRPVFGTVLDAAFIPAFVALLAWLPYIARIYDAVFRELRESGAQRIMSLVVLVGLAVAGAAGVLGSSVWLLAIGLAGFFSSVKLLMLSQRGDLNHTAREHLRVWGILALYVALFFGLLGASDWYIAHRDINTPHARDIWLIANSIMGLIVVTAGTLLVPVHISRSAVSQIKGLIARPLGPQLVARELPGTSTLSAGPESGG